jgi:sensor histidine kinase YesM
MCNPPGGDWSGISYFDFLDKTEYRWTSLPRVSETKAKRPDHIIQIHTKKEEIFLVIESKNNARDLDENIGVRLTQYVNVLFKIPPTAYKPTKQDWQSFTGKKSPLNNAVTYSGGSFVYKNLAEMENEMQDGKLDFVLAFEFKNDGTETIGHLLLSDKSKFLNGIFTDIVSQFNGSFKIKIY